jgi:uncharacterized membrane protein YagU involved in acid resistance
MYSKAILKYYIDINIFNVPFCLLFGLLSGFLSGLVIFCSFGILVGYLGYQYFKKHEYYTYYNLGLTKLVLIRNVFLLNIFFSILLALIYLIIN